MQAASLCMSKSAWKDCVMMSKNLAVVLFSKTGAHLVLIVFEHTGNCSWQMYVGWSIVVSPWRWFYSVSVLQVRMSDVAGCRKRVFDDYECIQVHDGTRNCSVFCLPWITAALGESGISMMSLLILSNRPIQVLLRTAQTLCAFPRGQRQGPGLHGVNGSSQNWECVSIHSIK